MWFLWATGKDLDGLARFATTADYYIFASIGSTWAYFALAGVVFLFNAAAVFYLFRPHPVGYGVLLGALAAGIAQNLVSTLLAVRAFTACARLTRSAVSFVACRCGKRPWT